MGAEGIQILEQVSAAKKLGAETAAQLLNDATKLITAKGKKAVEFNLQTSSRDQVLSAMLGPTGNLRAPTLKYGKTLIVGYHEQTYIDLFG